MTHYSNIKTKTWFRGVVIAYTVTPYVEYSCSDYGSIKGGVRRIQSSFYNIRDMREKTLVFMSFRID